MNKPESGGFRVGEFYNPLLLESLSDINHHAKAFDLLPAGSSSVTMIWPVQGAEVPANV